MAAGHHADRHCYGTWRLSSSGGTRWQTTPKNNKIAMAYSGETRTSCMGNLAGGSEVEIPSQPHQPTSCSFRTLERYQYQAIPALARSMQPSRHTSMVSRINFSVWEHGNTDESFSSDNQTRHSGSHHSNRHSTHHHRTICFGLLGHCPEAATDFLDSSLET